MKDFEIMYTCHGCGLERRKVNVRRRRNMEDILEWMSSIGKDIDDDHKATCPWCKSRNVDLMLPVSEEAEEGKEGIGETPAPLPNFDTEETKDYLKARGLPQ